MSDTAAAMDLRTVEEMVGRALAEDRADRDMTTAATVPPDQPGRAVLVMKAPGVLCGLPFLAAAFRLVDPRLRWSAHAADGDAVSPGQAGAEVSGALASILRAERVGLNFVQRLSGVATLTRRAVEAVAGTEACILDTRKTTPGLRAAERYAVRVGGALNHRDTLASGILIKDNHIAAVRLRGGTLSDAVRAALAQAGPATGVEVEVTSLADLEEALAAGAPAVLLDNCPLEALGAAVERAHSAGVIVEASGGITLATVRAVAETGVDYISLGALTHSAPALDLSLEVEAGA